MTHLRKIMLEELERRNYAQTTIHAPTSRPSKISHVTSIALPTNSVRNTFASTKPICSANENSPHPPLRNV